MNNKIKEFLYLTINKIKGEYKRDVNDIYNVVYNFIISLPYEVFNETGYCKIEVFDSGCAIGNITRGEENLLCTKPDFYCAKVIIKAIKRVRKCFGKKISISVKYKVINIDVL